MPRQGHSSRQRGIERVDQQTIGRWQEDGKRYALYRYQAEHLLWDEHDQWRLPDVHEMETFMGFPQGYTNDSQNVNTEHEREQFLGNSMHTGVLNRILEDAPFGRPKPPLGNRGQRRRRTEYTHPPQAARGT